MTSPTMQVETIDQAKSALILKLLMEITEGPREAYGVLCLAIYTMNFEINDHPVPVDQLAAELSTSLLSIKRHGTQ